MNVGDYVRTKKGTFDRFITSHTQDNLTWYTFEDRGNITNPENYIIKSSPNIIDLIEVGDILTFEDGSICRIIGIEDKYYLLKDLGDTQYYERQEIVLDGLKSIVTKEQFESMGYKIGE